MTGPRSIDLKTKYHDIPENQLEAMENLRTIQESKEQNWRIQQIIDAKQKNVELPDGFTQVHASDWNWKWN